MPSRYYSTFAVFVLGCSQSVSPEERSTPEPARAEFADLAYLSLPELPEDSTNALLSESALAERAAEFGQRLFFERRFAGPLLDPDNVRYGGDDPYIESGPLGNVGETGKVACASCHLPGASFLDVRSARQTLSLGAGWTPRRAISLLDVGAEALLMWDGRRDAHWNQIFSPLESHLEMNSGRLYVAQVIAGDARHKADYEALFGALPALDEAHGYPALVRPGCVEGEGGQPTDCHGMPGDGAEYDALSAEGQAAVTRVVTNLGKAIQAYERQLRCGISRFDLWVFGDDAALSAEEVQGAELFVGKAGCVQCHRGPYLSDGVFHNIGIEPGGPQELFMTPDDPGASAGLAEAVEDATSASGEFSDDPSIVRLPESAPSSMLGAFKTPKLRCVSRRPSYLHTGQYRSLVDVVAFKNRGGDHAGFAGESELVPLGLSAEEEAALVAFLESLDGLSGTGTPERWTAVPTEE
jgi:cytochrome c peroxidase